MTLRRGWGPAKKPPYSLQLDVRLEETGIPAWKVCTRHNVSRAQPGRATPGAEFEGLPEGGKNYETKEEVGIFLERAE